MTTINGKEHDMHGRKAYGAHRTMSPETKARNVAASIAAHGLNIDEPQTWERYGLQDNPAQQELVRKILGR